jgi:SAM-dependent methyltransferase
MTATAPDTSERQDEIRPISHLSTNQKVFSLVAPVVARGGRVLDVGAGEGYFSKSVGEYATAHGISPAAALRACDLFPELFRYQGIRCDPIGADGRLPYDDGGFDLVCSLEVVEHLEDQFRFARELFRVTKPGGRAIVSTPNVLNVNSRYRFLHSGFGVLFDPLPLSSSDPVHTSGHIHPIAFYYVAYLFRRACMCTSTAASAPPLPWPSSSACRSRSDMLHSAAGFGARRRSYSPRTRSCSRT